jgi:Protein of unknown function (DUF1571)
MSTAQQCGMIHTDSRARCRTGRQPRRLWYYGAVAVLGVALLGGGQRPSSAPQAAPPAAPQPMGHAAPAEAAASPMDEPLRLLLEARQAHQSVRDYTCLLVKRERVNGVLTPENVMEMKVRTQPFSVYFRWLQPRSEAGQEVCYVAGLNDGKMRVRPRGVLGAVGFVSLDPNDPRARQTSRRSITEAGIGGMIERFAKGWETERRLNQTQARIADYEYNRRRCTRVETIHPTNPDGQFLYYRTVMYFDKEYHLPIRLECYDWPRHQGDPGEVVEIYSFANLRINVGLSDDVFNH